MKTFCIGIILGISLLAIPFAEQQLGQDISPNNFIGQQVLCSTATAEKKCTGSPYCRACKNCKYCKYCSNGGSCGVCRKTPVKNNSISKKKTKAKPHPKKRSISSQQSTQTLPTPPNLIYIVSENTNLRTAGNANANIIRPLNMGDEVRLIDSSQKNWWKVIHNAKEGWVEKHLLKEKK